MKVYIFYNDAENADHKFSVFSSKDAAVRCVMDLYSQVIGRDDASESALRRWAESAIEECDVREDY